MAGPLIYRGSFASILVYNPTTNLQQRFDVGASRTDGEYLPYFTQLSVKVGLASNAEITVSLAPPTYKEFIALIEGPWCRVGNTLGVRWGYTDDPAHVSPWFYTFMQKPEITIDASWNVNLIGTGFEWAMKRSGAQKVWASPEADPEKKLPGPRSLIEVIKEICGRTNLEVVVNDQLFTDFDLATALFKPQNAIVQSGMNDWAFIRMELRKLGCRGWVDRGFKFMIHKASVTEKPRSLFVMFGPAKTAEDTFPMWNYRTETSAFFLQGRGVSATQFGGSADRSTKVATVADATVKQIQSSGDEAIKRIQRYSASSLTSRITALSGTKDFPSLPTDLKAASEAGGVRAWAPIKNEQTLETFPVASNEEFATILAQGRSDITAESTGVSVEFDSLDDPTLSPGDLIRIENVGLPFEGNFRVFEIEHRIGAEFGAMHLKVGQMGLNEKLENKMFDDAAKSKDEKPKKSGSSDKSGDGGAGV